jgi:hypothetical protein
MDYIWDVNELSNVSGSGTRDGVAIAPTEVQVDGGNPPQKKTIQSSEKRKFRKI